MQLIKRKIRRFIKDILYDTMNPYTTKLHSTWYKYINENSHVFLPNENSQYRQSINYIVNYILNPDKKEGDVQLYKNNSDIYEKYFILLPFHGISHINVINCLKIYIHYHAEKYIDVYNVADNINTDDYNINELPLYKSYGSTISKVSIIFDVPYNITKNEIISILAHELSHILNYVKSLKLGKTTTKWEIARDTLVKLQEEYKDNIKAYNMCGYACNCCYYLQNTEINAHIENIISEFKLNNFSRDTALTICKYQMSLLQLNIDEEVLKYYLTSDNSFTIYMQIYERTLFYKKHIVQETNYMKEIARVIYPNSNNIISFKKIVNYWDKLLLKFFRNLSSAIYNTYEK